MLSFHGGYVDHNGEQLKSHHQHKTGTCKKLFLMRPRKILLVHKTHKYTYKICSQQFHLDSEQISSDLNQELVPTSFVIRKGNLLSCTPF